MDIQMMAPDTLANVSKIEIDTQISTAKAYPRDLAKVLNQAKHMATLNTEIAESCNYAKPGKILDKKTGQYVDGFHTGPSIRLAEILVSCYCNLRVATRVVGNNGSLLTAQAMFHDLETNTAISTNVDRSILTSKGTTYSNDMQAVTGNAACAIAFRNGAFKIIPAAYVQDIYKAVLIMITPKEDELPGKRQAAIDYFIDMGVTLPQILRALHVKTMDEIGTERLTILRGMATSISTGEMTKEEIFPPTGGKPEGGNGKVANTQTENLLKKK